MRILASIALILLGLHGMAQSYSFRNFNVEDGVSHPFIYDIVQDDKGYLWVATGEGLCKFNGFHFTNYFTNDGLAENFVSTLHKDAKGNIWMGHKQGGCSIFSSKGIDKLNTEQHFNSVIRAIRDDYQGNTWLLSQHSGMVKVSPERRIQLFDAPFSQYLLFDFQITEKNQMLVGTNEGLYLYNLEGESLTPKFDRLISDVPMTKINCITPGKIPGMFYVGTEDEGIYVVQLRANRRIVVKPLETPLQLYKYNIQSILEEPDNSLWIGTFGRGLVHLSQSSESDEYLIISSFDETNGLGSNDIKTVYRDREGNIWAGKFGGNHNAGGISSLSNNAFVFYDNPIEQEGPFYAVHGTEESFWMGLRNAIMNVDSGMFKQPRVYTEKHGLAHCLYTSVFVDEDRNVWAGSAQNGLFLKLAGDTVFSRFELSKDRLSFSINDIEGDSAHIWVATKNGIYEIDRNDLEVAYYNKESGLEHNVVKSLYLDDTHNLWYCTASSYLSYIKRGKIVNIVISEDQHVHDQTGITKDSNGNIWLATNGSGLFIFDYESIRTINTESHGLKSNFCYSIEVDHHNNVWVGHKGGLSCYNPKSDQLSIIDQNDDMYLDFQQNAAFKDHNGEIWMGTNKKLVRYNPSKDMQNSIPPIINIEAVRIEDDLYAGTHIDLPYGEYKAKFEFLGLSFRKANEVTYQYILEGHDRDWQEVSDNKEAHYSRIDPGDYTFRVVAFNSDGIKSPVPAEISIHIEKPYWQKAWFIGLSVAAFFVLMWSLVKIRDRRQRQVRQYLEKTLDIRTKEVKVKSRELEQKNKDITSSIHYAKKIQNATLPDQTGLQRNFPNAFIYYQPRDIISGDFYWFTVKNNKLLLCVADCTGHGVPGALLSMIGSTKLDHIVTHSDIEGPDNILRKLDEDLRMILHQNALSEGPQDGMDVVMAEIDLDTNWLRITSAMGNAYIASDDGVHKISGDRNSIGGNHLGLEKNFTLFERQMKAGDGLYLTSDGYQDQFGGEKGKKLKRSGFVALINTLRTLPAGEQKTAFKAQFDTWKGEHEQIDDVLLVGLKF